MALRELSKTCSEQTQRHRHAKVIEPKPIEPFRIQRQL